MNAAWLRSKFLEFFKLQGHQIIPSASLIPQGDSTVLFTTAGMHPLVPYLQGQLHPLGKRLASVQKCLRTDDISEIGDGSHNTFFEMLGNWSLGDYWKEESITFSFEFLTAKNWLDFDRAKLAVSVFSGDEDAPKDELSAAIWQKLGFPQERIAYLGKKDNWWGPIGNIGPCGPDTEMFFWTGSESPPLNFDPQDARWIEIWNNVFMEYEKTSEGKFVPLKQKNVDTGLGLERVTAILEKKANVFETELFLPVIEKIKVLASRSEARSEIIIADHLRAAVFLLADGVTPSNKERGYILRRLIRRSVVYGQKLGIDHDFTFELAEIIKDIYAETYPELLDAVLEAGLKEEELKFRKTLGKGLKMLEARQTVSGQEAFDLFQTYGFPFELTSEFVKVEDPEAFEEAFKKHQRLSRTSQKGLFKGGLINHSEKVIRLHTATHLLNAALRMVLGEQVWQKGSNINEERTRFDFTHEKKLTDDEKEKIENLVNGWIAQHLTVRQETMPLQEAHRLGALGVFGEKYSDPVSVYTIADENENIISREFCGGPHVKNTGEIGRIKITKEEAVSAGVRRIKAIIS